MWCQQNGLRSCHAHYRGWRKGWKFWSWKQHTVGHFCQILSQYFLFLFSEYSLLRLFFLNNRFLRERGITSNPKIEYQVFLCIFRKKSAMASLRLKEFSHFLQIWSSHSKVRLKNVKKSGIMKNGLDACLFSS